MDVAALTPLPVGIVPWQRPEPAFTVIVKATFRLVHGAEAVFAREQQPLGLDEPYPGPEPEEVRTPSDFAPLKAKVDTLLVGHARANSPTRAVAGQLSVDAMVRSFVAVASSPATMLPLSSRYVRESSAPDARATRLGPRAAPSEPWWGHLADRSCDFSRFNVAPASQQIDLLRTGAAIRLENLLPGESVCETRLPALRPRIFYCPWRNATEIGPGAEVLVRADTLWIDADSSLCTVTWRGVSLLHGEHHASAFVVVALRQAGETAPWGQMVSTVATARWVSAVEPAMVRVPPTWLRAAVDARELPPMPTVPRTDAPPSRSEVATVVTETMRPRTEPEAPLPFSNRGATQRTKGRAPALGMDPNLSPQGSTGVVDVAALRAQRALPFSAQQGSPDESTSSYGAARSTGAEAVVDRTLQSAAASGAAASGAAASGAAASGAAASSVHDVDASDSSIEPDPPTPRPTGSRPTGMRLGTTLLGGPSAKLGLRALGATDAAQRPPTGEAGDSDLAHRSGPTHESVGELGPAFREDLGSKASRRVSPTGGEAAAVASTGQAGTAPTEEPASASGSGLTGAQPAEMTPTPPSQAAASRAMMGRRRVQTQMTAVVDPGALRRGDALPFTSAILGQSLDAGYSSMAAPPPTTGSPSAKSLRTGTVELEDFARPAPAQPTPWNPKATPGAVDSGQPPPSIPIPAPSRPARPLDAHPPWPPPPGAPRSQPGALPSPPPPLPSSPAPPQHGPSAQRAAIPIEAYAQIKAELWRRPQDLALLLERHGISEAAWHANEKQQERALGEEAAAGKAELALRLRRALLAAKAALPEESAPELTLDEYVALRVEIDNAEDSAALLDKRGLTSGQWSKLRRQWQQRSLDDPALARELRAKLAESRRLHGEA